MLAPGQASARPHGLSPAVIAIDVGGTSIKGAVAGRTSFLVELNRPTRADQGPAAATEAVLAAARELASRVPASHVLEGVGLAVPGLIQGHKGMVADAQNLGWSNLPLAELAEGALGLPVRLGHDVRAGGMAELTWGAGRGLRSLVFVAVGTGIAAAVIQDGKLVTGGGLAGEVGHGGSITGEPCVCGGLGCLETFASAAAIAREYTRLSGRAVPGAREVAEALAAGDDAARLVWDRAAQGLGALVADAARWLGSPRVVLGGGLAEAGLSLVEPVTRAARARLTVHRVPEVVVAALGGRSGLAGAVILGWEAAGLTPPDLPPALV
jgi:glucokinase